MASNSACHITETKILDISYDELKKGSIAMGRLKADGIKKIEFRNVGQLWSTFQEHKTSIDTLLQSEFNGILLKDFRETFLIFFEHTILLSCWFEGNSVLLNTRIDSLASHCMKFVDLGSSQSTMMNFKNDVEYFSQEFSKKVKCEDDFCGRLLFLLQEQFGDIVNQEFPLIATPASFTECIDKLESKQKDLDAAAELLITCRTKDQMHTSAERFVFLLGDISDIFMQVNFLMIANFKPISFGQNLISHGQELIDVSVIERSSVFYSQEQLLKDIEEAYQLKDPPAVKELKNILKSNAKLKTIHRRISNLRSETHKLHSSYIGWTKGYENVVVLTQIQKYNQFLLAAKEALVKYITVHYKGTNDAWDFSSISAILEVIVRDLRVSCRKQELLKPLISLELNKHCNDSLLFLAISCKRYQYLKKLDAYICQWNIKDKLLFIEEEIKTLEVILKSVYSVLQCAKNVQEMEKKFFEFVNDIILYLSLDEDIKLIEKKDIYEKVVYFSRTLSTDVETLIDVLSVEGEDQFYKDIGEIFPFQKFGSPNQAIILRALIRSDTFDVQSLGVEIFFKTPGRSVFFQTFIVIGNCNNGNKVVRSEFLIPRNCCTRLYYRYTIKFVPEFLSATKRTSFNEVNDCYRVITIPYSDQAIEVYDSVIHQRILRRTLVTKFWVFFGQEEDFEPPNRSNEISITLNCHLEEQIRILEESRMQSEEDINFSFKIMSGVIQSFVLAKVIKIASNEGVMFYQEDYSKETLKLLNSVVASLYRSPKIERILSALALCRCLMHCKLLSIECFCQSFLPNLISLFKPTFEGNQCLEYNVVRKTFHNLRSDFINAFLNVMTKHLHFNCGKISVDILNALSFCFWFDGNYLPFGKIPASLASLSQCYEHNRNLFQLNILRKSEMEDIKKCSSLLFEATFMLQYVVVRASPESLYHTLIESVQPPIFLICIMKGHQGTMKFQQIEKILRLLLQDKEHFISPFAVLINDILLNLLNDVKSDGQLCDKTAVNKLAIQILLHCKIVNIDIILNILRSLALSNFGSSFAEGGGHQNEQKFWTEYYVLDSSNEKWRSCLISCIQSRLGKSTSFDKKVSILMQLENDKASIAFLAVQGVIEELTYKRVIVANEALQSKTIQHFERSATLKAMLCRGIQKKFASSKIDIHSILQWNYWPLLLKAMRDHDPASASTYCATIKQLLESDIGLSLSKGELAVDQVHDIHGKWKSHLVQLFSFLDLDEKRFLDFLLNCLEKEKVFALCLVLIDIFLSNRLPSSIINLLAFVKSKLFDLKSAYSSLKIKDLCEEVEKNLYVFPCFEEINPLAPMLLPFAILHSESCSSDIFHNFWYKKTDKDLICLNDIVTDVWNPVVVSCEHTLRCLKQEEITIREAFEMFSSKEKVDNVLAIKNLACAFSIMNKLEWKNLASMQCPDMQSLKEIISKTKSSLSGLQWTSFIAEKIYEWVKVTKYSESADFVLDLLSKLEIKLSPMEYGCLAKFSSKEIHLLECTMLKDVSSELVFMKKQLERMKQFDKKLLHSVKCFFEKVDLRKWIQEKSESLHEMEKFVSIAMDAVAGEGHEVQDRLAHLRQLCSRFSMFLYDLSSTREMEIINLIDCLCKFETKAGNVSWDNNILIIEDCAKNLEWYMEKGELQGSVEKGALKELEDINTLGQYMICLCEDSGNYKISLLVSSNSLQNIVHRQWELQELQELESKLILITRENSDWIETKEMFQKILQQIVKIAVIVQKLKDYGHKEYMNCKMEFMCAAYTTKQDFGKMIECGQAIESELCHWINHVWHCRQTYYCLNFFTNQQLVILRNELEALQNDKNASAGSQLLHLLCSITGRSLKSTYIIRRILNGENVESPLMEDTLLDDVEVTSCKGLEPESCSNNVVEEESFVDKFETAVQELNETQKEVYFDLEDMNYDKYLAFEAVMKTEDVEVYSAMEWCDNHLLDDDFNLKLQEKWKKVTTYLPVIENISENHTESLNTYDKMSEIGNFFIPFHYTSHRQSHTRTNFSDCALEDLGIFLQNVARILKVEQPTSRVFPDYLKPGFPNLVVVHIEIELLAVLQLYLHDKEKPLPSFEEVLLCSSETSLEEVAVFLMRAICDPDQHRIYCLVHCEKLKYLVAEKAMDIIDVLSQGNTGGYRLVLICSSDGDQKSIPVSRLQSYRRAIPQPDSGNIQKYIRYHLSCSQNLTSTKVLAPKIDDENFRVRFVSSKKSGVGKTLYVRRMKEKLVKHLTAAKTLGQGKLNELKVIATVSLHGPIVTRNEVMSMLLADQDSLQTSIIHLDIPQKVLNSLDDILFSLIVLQGLCKDDGQIWRCLPSQYYLIETVLPSENHYLRKFPETQQVLSILELLPTVDCVEPDKIVQKFKNIENQFGIDVVEVNTPMYQRVYQYLCKIQNGNDLETFQYTGTMEGDEYSCLQMIMKYCGVNQPSWKEIRHFVWFLNVQLSACEQSNVLRRVNGLKTFVAKFMIEMSKDFSTSSVSSSDDGSHIQHYQVRKTWEKSMHPYIFFNKNRTSVTQVGMSLARAQNGKISLHDHSTNNEIDIAASQEVLNFLENVAKVPRNDNMAHQSFSWLERLADFLNIKDDVIASPDSSYVLTRDNVTKIMGIQMRFRCRIPVVLMGETGCGKTHLIRFMCQFAAYKHPEIQNMFILKVHGGTTEAEVIECIQVAEQHALVNRKLGIETVVFFDEANTSNVISLIKEVMCDGRYRGKMVPPFLKFIAACNPYRQHDEKMKTKLRNAGLGWSQSDHSQMETLGEIPLRDLVYRVMELPASMRALVYDFGRLSDEMERKYIFEIVKNQLNEMQQKLSVQVVNEISRMFDVCQRFMRDSKDECSFVSLRDIERAAIVFNYFHECFLNIFEVQPGFSRQECSLLLTIHVCYHSRIERRHAFEKHLNEELQKTGVFLKLTSKTFIKMVSSYQMKLLDCMEIHQNIARNAALRENVFMMVICIELKIPLFIVGKPGSSKSLAKSIISNSMRGDDSLNDCLKKLKKVRLSSHQCNPLSTPESIIEVFNKAQSEQVNENIETFVSVVVLDEVGLAEASPHLPLKALHPLLEDGTEGSGKSNKNKPEEFVPFSDNRRNRNERVGFIGISNWALDPAKMNRGIMVTRGEPTVPELIESARGICNIESDVNTPAFEIFASIFSDLADAYNTISTKQKRDFFGLRDFYSLIKMLYWMMKKSETVLTKAQLVHAIRRNFDGYDDSELDPLKEFEKALMSSNFKCDFENDDLVLLVSPDDKYVTVVDDCLVWEMTRSKAAQFVMKKNKSGFVFQSLVRPNLYLGSMEMSEELGLSCHKEFIGVSRHSDYTTLDAQLALHGIDTFHLKVVEDPDTNPDCSSLGLIKASLQTKDISWHGESRYLLFLTENYSALQTLKQYIIATTESVQSTNCEPFVLFGSNFPKDNEYMQVCRNVSEVRLCMETGRMVILLNLENLYESLYDVLNQYYLEAGGHRYVDLGLRANKTKCRVHEDFKLILIAEKTQADNFPIPLVNRMEKHFVSSKTVLDSWQATLCTQLEEWVKEVSCIQNGIRVEDVFIGYNSDTVAAVVLQASAKHQMEKSVVCRVSKSLLLQLASPDGVFRYMSKNSEPEIQDIYFTQQEHSSISHFFHRLGEERMGKLIQVTSHAHSLSQHDINVFAEQLKCEEEDIVRLHLESFHTEQDFIDSIRKALEKGLTSQHILMLECDAGHVNGNLISCCRYRIVDIRNDGLKDSMTCILLLIHLPRKYPKSTFVSFQEHPWNCYHVDELIVDLNFLCLSNLGLVKYSVADIFQSDLNKCPIDHRKTNPPKYFSSFLYFAPLEHRKFNFCDQLHKLIPEAVASSSITANRIKILQLVIPQYPCDQDDIYDMIVSLVKKKLLSDADVNDNWIVQEASNISKLEETGSFSNALVEKLKRIVFPALRSILVFFDQFDNLNHIIDENERRKHAWITIFHSDELCGDFSQNTTSQMKGGMRTCEFPFSWVLYEFCEQNIKSVQGKFEDVKAKLNNLETILNEISSDLIKTYLNDFVRLTYTSVEENLFDVLASVTLNMMKSASQVKDILELSLHHAVMLIHFIHRKNWKHFDWLCNLVSHVPRILKDVELYQKMQIKEVVLVAVNQILKSNYFNLKEPFHNGKTALKGWIQKLYEIQSIVESVLKNSSSSDILVDTRLVWKWMFLQRMFVEHVVLKNEKEMLFISKRIEKMSEGKQQDQSSLNILALFLCSVEQGLGKVENVKNRKAIHDSCWILFKEALTHFCLDSDDPKSKNRSMSELVDACFFSRSDAPVKLNQFLMKFHREKVTSFQAWVIKSVCSFNEEIPEIHLGRIFSTLFDHSSANFIGNSDALFVASSSLFGFLSLQSKESSFALFQNGFYSFQSHRAQPLSYPCMKAVSQIHFTCQTIAEAIHQNSLEIEESRLPFFAELIAKLELNDDDSFTGPLWYLMRVVARKFGLPTLIKASKSDVFDWTTSVDIFEKETEMWHYFDPSSIYNPMYEELRSAVSELLADSQGSNLDPKALDSQQAIPLVLAIYERIRQSYVCILPSKRSVNTREIDAFLVKCTVFKPFPRVLKVIQEIVSNTHCKQLPQMSFKADESHEDHLIRTLVVHAIVTLSINLKNRLTMVFSNVLQNPEVFATQSLPTMHVLKTDEVSYQLHTYPECTNKHRHTNIMVNQLCPLCGCIVNKQSDLNPGQSFTRSISLRKGYHTSQATTGFLSPVSYGIIRSIMYSCLLWSSCNNKTISALLHDSICDPPAYFWGKINQSLEVVQRATGRSIDDVVLIVHLIIQEIEVFGQGPIVHQGDKQNIVDKILTEEDQHEWECQFESTFIAPVLNNISERMKKVLNNLTSRDHNRLFSSLYLYEDVPNPGSDTSLWQYNPHVTMNHFLLHNMSFKLEKEHPALFFLLDQMDSLSATKFIGDIVNVLQVIHDVARQSNESKLEKLKFSEFILQYITDKKKKGVIKGKFNRLCDAWQLSRSSLYMQNYLELDTKFRETDISETSSISCLIPAMQGDGLLCVALLDHLIRTHNCLIQLSRNFVEKTLEREWLLHTRKVHLMSFDAHDFIDYKDVLFDLVVKHSFYELTACDPVIAYDLFGLEKDLVCRFVLNKRMIIGHADIPQVVWELSTTVLTLSLIEQRIPQKELSPQAVSDILEELKTVAQLVNVMDILKIVMTYMRNDVTLDPHKLLKSYMQTLQLQLRSISVGEHCCLKHIKSTWRLLNIEVEKLHCRNDETPFPDTEEVYVEEISEVQKCHLKLSLRKVSNLEDMIRIMYDFIQKYMKYQSTDEKLFKALRSSALPSGVEQDVMKYKDVLREDFQVKHAVMIWKYIVLFQTKLKKQSLY